MNDFLLGQGSKTYVIAPGILTGAVPLFPGLL